jgi:hypothetical protein
MKFLSMLAAAALFLVAPFAAQAQVQNCNATIIDQAGVVRNPQVIANSARNLINSGADVKVVIVDSIQRYGSSLSDVERNFEATCTNWTDSSGQRKANLFVVMVAPHDRAKNIFLGSYYAGSFDVTSTYSQLANSYFKNGQFDLGIANTLNGTTPRAIAYRQRVVAQQAQARQQVQTRTYTAPVTTYPTQQADSGTSGVLIFFLVLLGLGVVGVVAYAIYRASTSSDSTPTTTYSSHDTVFTPSPSSYGYRTRGASVGGGTTIINNTTPQYDSSGNLITGVLLGEALSRPNSPTVVYEQAPSTPVYTDPTPTPSVTPDAPDSTWEAPVETQTTDTQDTGWSQPDPDPAPDYSQPDTSSWTDTSSGNSDSGF